jgi:5-hydroxyisourate hydrolase-like protein (transthyretin family)
MQRSLALSVTLLFIGLTNASQSDFKIPTGFGAIAGQVVDAQTGEPIAKAKVQARPDDAGSARVIQSALSDEKGNFFLNELLPGRYVIPASKEDAGYPDTDAAAFAGTLTILPRVLVREGQITGNVTVRIEKGCRFSGSILDTQTKEPVIRARIKLTRADHPEWWLLTGPDKEGRFRFVIPSVPFLVEISAPGYRTWHYSSSGSDRLLLKPQSEENISVPLQKE